jgi:intracellular sulfur oxidation DsrE/DsrF family protein
MRYAWVIFILSGALGGMIGGCAGTGGAESKANIAPDKVVYHVNDAGAQAAGALRNINNQQFIPEATFVPSGVAEITRLQQREGYAYLRP